MPKENISLEADGQNLRLSVQEVQSDEKSGDTWHRVERSSQVRMPYEHHRCCLCARV